MIRNTQTLHGAVNIYRMTEPRRRARRTRTVAIAVTMAVAFSGGLLQQFYHQANMKARLGEAEAPIPTGPFAYFPR